MMCFDDEQWGQVGGDFLSKSSNDVVRILVFILVDFLVNMMFGISLEI